MNQSSRRAELLAKAAILFRQKGYAATSIRDIASAMEMKSPSLYNHIKSKEEILQVLLLDVARHYVAGMKDVLESPLNPLQQLERIIADHIRITIEQTNAVALIPSDWIHLDETSRQEFMRLRDTYDRNFRGLLKDCIEQGYLAEFDVDIASFSILSTLRWLFSWYKKRELNPIHLETELVRNLIGGLKPAT
ncbi:MAG: TetR/AcrR family transcriptional regulator [Bacteroidota bacterium]